MSQVRGKVHYADGSVPRGGIAVVRFQPTDASSAEIRKGATGGIAPDGSFELFTRVSGDGVYHGEYAVTFSICKSVADPTPLIPSKYVNGATTPFKVTVDRDIDDLNFEIERLPGSKGRAADGAAG